MPWVVEVEVEVISVVGMMLTKEVGKLPMGSKLPPVLGATESETSGRVDGVFEVELAVLELAGIAVAWEPSPSREM